MSAAVDWLSEYGQLVKTGRDERQWSQRYLAESAHVSRGLIERIERGDAHDFDFHQLERVFTALGLQIEAQTIEGPVRLDPKRLLPAERARRTWSRRDLARYSGLRSSTIDRMEAERFDWVSIKKLSYALETLEVGISVQHQVQPTLMDEPVGGQRYRVIGFDEDENDDESETEPSGAAPAGLRP